VLNIRSDNGDLFRIFSSVLESAMQHSERLVPSSPNLLSNSSEAGLPDGTFSYEPKDNLGSFCRALELKMLVYFGLFVTFYGHLVILWLFGIFFTVLVYCTTTNLATLFRRNKNVFIAMHNFKTDICLLAGCLFCVHNSKRPDSF
jgi:hypothetical protein